MKRYVVQEDKKRETMVIHDEVLVRHALFPFWMMSNPRPDLGAGAFLCFIGCNYPDGIQSHDEKEWLTAFAYMNKGFLNDWKKSDKEGKKRIGWGGGETPTKAFQSALKSSGAFREGGKG